MAGAELEILVDEVQERIAETTADIRPKAAGDPRFGRTLQIFVGAVLAVGNQARYCFGRQDNVRVAAVLLLQHAVKARPVALDQVIFQDQAFCLVVDDDGLNVTNLRHQPLYLPVFMTTLEIGGKPTLQVFGLANVNHLPLRVLHQVAAGLGGVTGGGEIKGGHSEFVKYLTFSGQGAGEAAGEVVRYPKRLVARQYH